MEVLYKCRKRRRSWDHIHGVHRKKKNNKKQKSIPKAKTKSNTSTAYEKSVYTVSVDSNAPSSNRSCINNPRNTNPAALSKTKKYREKADVQ